MLKLPLVDENILKQAVSSKFILSGFDTVEDPELIPFECEERLISPLSNASVNELGKQLLKAAAEGNVADTRALLGKGALFTADWLGTSPLHLAAKNNNLEIVEMLLKAGISRDARTKVDKTSLHMAAAEGHLEVVKLLLEYGSDPDCRDMLGMTPLHWAVQNGHFDVVKVLLHFAQTDIVNKFDLKPTDIAMQINRQDIVELINLNVSDCEQNNAALALELVENEDVQSASNSPIPLETILMEDTENSVGLTESDPTILSTDSSFAESIRLLQEQAITMLPNDENNILTSAMESGHSVVLTDAGKQLLNAFKEPEQKNVLTVTPEEFLTMTTKSKKYLKQINGRLVPKNVKRIVMKKNKLIPVSSVNSVYKVTENVPTDMETVMSQLIEARKTIEEYKIKLVKKEQEAEKYKQQLRLLMNDS